jgi:uncharacterized protein (DUF924 family)
MTDYQSVIDFWFKELSSQQWWVKDDDLDQTIKERFLSTLKKGRQCELYPWRSSAQGRLAEIIVLDQFPRNIYRNQKESFSHDSMALALAQEAVSLGVDKKLSTTEKQFLYLPYMHSESLLIHERAVELYSQPGLEFNLDFEYKHKKIIERFGRYPHRNQVLGRTSTDEELQFLQEPGSSF